MRKLLMTTILALGAVPVWADDTALILGNERYDEMDRVVGAGDVNEAAVALTREGVRVYATMNGDWSDVRAQAGDFLADRDDLTSQVVALSGRFATDGARTWFLARDTGPTPGPFTVGSQGISVETLLGLLADTPARSIMLLGLDEGEQGQLGPRMREGIGNLDIPQGVTVVIGSNRAIADLLEDVIIPGGDVIRAVNRSRRLSMTGFVPPTLALELGNPDARGGEVVDRVQDNRDWERARELDTANSYSAYISNHPRGAYVSEAREKLQEIRSEPNRAERLVEEAMELDRNDRRAVQRDLTVLNFDTRGIDGIFGPGTRRAITNWQQQNGFSQTGYLTANQVTRIDAQAARRAAELEAQAERQRRAEEQRDEAYWEETGAAGEEPGLRAYLDRYPDGKYSDRAEAALEDIQEAKRARVQARDRNSWDVARQTNTVASYRQYLSDRPNGAFREEATARIQRLRQQDDGASQQEQARATETALRLDPLTRRLIEARLAQLGLEPGRVDGEFDRATRRAIRRYQRDRGLARTGFLNTETVSRMLRDGRN